jgi:hypothetical protein
VISRLAFRFIAQELSTGDCIDVQSRYIEVKEPITDPQRRLYRGQVGGSGKA